MSGRSYTLDVNPTSASRVKVRLYETRAVEQGGNILLLQGQLSLRQFKALEALLHAGAKCERAVFEHTGRHYTSPAPAPPSNSQVPSAQRPHSESRPRAVAGADRQPRAPWTSGPVIAPHGLVPDDDADEDYDALARRHVERALRRQSST